MADNVNKNLILTIVVIGVLLFGIVGFAAFSMMNSDNVVVNNTVVTPPVTPPAASQAGTPVVKTDSQTAPYISTVVVKGTVNPNGLITTYWFEI